MRTFPVPILITIPLAAIATVAILAALINRDGPSAVELGGVDPVALAETGTTLVDPPQGTTPKVSAEAARRSVEETHVGDTIREVRLAQLTYQYDKESAPKLVWAVSLDPSGHSFTCGGFGSPTTCATPRFLLAFVDANTGEFLSSVMH